MNLSTAVKALKKNKVFLISTHVNPDPDALCSELALAFYLKSKGKTVHVINEETVPRRFMFLPGAKTIKRFKNKQKINYDVAIIVDCGELDRIGKVQALIDKKKKIINIDHHVTNDKFGHINVLNSAASSTAEILYGLLDRAKAKITKNIAVLLYLGIMTDTGSFRYETTTAHTHSIVSRLMKFKFSIPELYRKLYESVPVNDLKFFTKVVSNFESLLGGKVLFVELRKKTLANFSEAFDLRDKIFRFLRTIKGVEGIVIFTEHKRQVTRVNFRSQGRLNVAKIAHHFNGGGHKRASGCVIEDSLKGARQKVFKRIKREL